MKKLRITITEKEKLLSSFNLFNFREEIVNFMYKKTVANSSRNSMVFYVLIFFLSLKIGSKSLLLDLIDNNIENLKTLNGLLSGKKRLKKGEYAKLVNEAGLTNVFRFDVFFLLLTAIANSEEIEKEFKTFLQKNPAIHKDFQDIIKKYKSTFKNFSKEFSSNVIVDDRYDDRGEYHDLSKSVSRTIRMRTSRHLDLPLHKYAEVKSIKSSSPVVVQVIQSIDPEILIKIWEIYNLDEYVKLVWKLKDNALFVSTISGILSAEWVIWRTRDGKKERKEKAKAKENYEIAKANESPQRKDLLESLARSVISSNEYLQSEIKELKAQLVTARKESSLLMEREKEIKDLEQKIERLENISIQVDDVSGEQ